jgi:hypothetical protein
LRNVSIIIFFPWSLTLDSYPPVHREKEIPVIDIMTEDVRGIWEGTHEWRTAPAYEAYGGAVDGFDLDLDIKRTNDIAQADNDVKLAITSQDNYRKFGTAPGPLVSIVSGQLDYIDPKVSTPVSGFVDDTGVVKLSFYWASSRDDLTFVGRLTSRGLVRDISGNLMIRVAPGTSWTDRFASYYFAKLSVHKPGMSLSDHAVIVDYGHVF